MIFGSDDLQPEEDYYGSESDYGEPMPPPKGEERRPYLSKNIVERLRLVTNRAEAGAGWHQDLELEAGIKWIRRLCDWHDKRRKS